MAKPTAEAIAKWAEDQDKPTDSGSYKRLTDVERALILKLRESGLTQVEIAQRLDRAQSTISDVLDAFTDTTPEAKRYLRGKALEMARNIVDKGRAADHIKALEGINVLSPEQVSGITVQIGIKADTVKLLGSTFALPGQVTSEGEQNR